MIGSKWDFIFVKWQITILPQLRKQIPGIDLISSPQPQESMRTFWNEFVRHFFPGVFAAYFFGETDLKESRS